MKSDRTVCSMCHGDMSPESLDRHVITGNVCDECLSRYDTREGMPLEEFLDMLGVPVLLTDGDAEVELANKPLLRLLNKEVPRVRGHRLGDVFECAHARLPGGCGRTVHCSGCTIRRCVTETFTTGRSLRNVEAYLNRDMVTQFQQLGMRVSTEKAWGMVLLRVEHVGPRQESRPPNPEH